MRRWIASSSLILVLPLACSETPDEVSVGPSGGGTTTSAGLDTGPAQATAADTIAGSGDFTGSMTSAVDTTIGVTVTGTTNEPDSDGGSGPPPGCAEPCGSNEVCSDGECVAVCDQWGEGNYDYCLDGYGGFDTTNACGPGNTLCAYFDVPIEATACSVQGCTSVCECPGPPGTGTSTVTCDDITNDGADDCFLSCADGETCPEGMDCMVGAMHSFCMSPVVELPQYGNCANVAANCVPGTECATYLGNAVCVEVCGGAIECDASPPGAMFAAACYGVIFPPEGQDCHVPCTLDAQCPVGMVCISTDVNGGDAPDLCMWPPL